MMLLGDLGAEVIKVEDPTTEGDEARRVPPFADAAARDGLYYQSLNRGARSLTLNLRAPGARDLLHRLVARSDAVYNNLRGDLPAKLALDYAGLGAANPRIVCCSLSGFGRTGPRPAHQVRHLDRRLLGRHSVGPGSDDWPPPGPRDGCRLRPRRLAARHRHLDAQLHGDLDPQPRLAPAAAARGRASEPGPEPELPDLRWLAGHHVHEGEVLGAARGADGPRRAARGSAVPDLRRSARPPARARADPRGRVPAPDDGGVARAPARARAGGAGLLRRGGAR